MPDIMTLSGEVIADRYELHALLGQGSFGAVYRAEDQRGPRPPLAIKVLFREHFADPRMRARFLREAELLARLNHPHIVPIHDFGMDLPRERAYLVMPYMDGGTMGEFLAQLHTPLGITAILDILRQVCGALDYLHAAQIVHLDLKPQNILRSLNGALLLADFGLAHRLVGEQVRGGSSLCMGTPFYMAPEHFDGRPERRSDIYAVGILLFRLLAGVVPFQGSPLEVLAGHLQKPPPSLLALRTDLPAAIDEVVRVALAKRPEHRYATAGALLAAASAAFCPPVPSTSAVPGSPRASALVDPYAPTEQAHSPPVLIDLTARASATLQPPGGQSHLGKTLSGWREALRRGASGRSPGVRLVLPALLALAAHAGLQWVFWTVLFPFLHGQLPPSSAAITIWIGLFGGAVAGLLATRFAREARAGHDTALAAPGWRTLHYLSLGLAWLSGSGLAFVGAHALGAWVRLWEGERFVAVADAVCLGLGVLSFFQGHYGTGFILAGAGSAFLAGARLYYLAQERGWHF